MEPGGIKKGDEEVIAETCIDRSHSSLTQSEEEREITVLKWQFELMLDTIAEKGDTSGE